MKPASAALQRKLGELSEDKTALLRLLLDEQSRQTSRILPRDRGSGADSSRLPTSSAQQRLWFLDQLRGAGAAYHIPIKLRLRGALNSRALQEALDDLVRRHEALRTIFVSVDGFPRQEVLSDVRFVLEIVDLRMGEKGERESLLLMHEAEEGAKLFDLRTGPLIRARLLHVQEDEHVLLVTMHHIISDGWSIGVMIHELGQAYGARVMGQPNPLSPLPIQYADYAQWQHEWLQGEVLEKQLAYWRGHLQGAAPQLELPTDRPRAAVQSFRGSSLDFVLDADLSRQLKSLAQRHKMTLFMVLYAGWAILLSRLSGQNDVVIGTPVANRQRPEVEGLVGLFVNSLALRLEIDGDMQVTEVLHKVKEVTLAAFDHQELPFEQVVEALQPQRSLGRNPLFQVMLVLQNAPLGELRLPGLTIRQEAVSTGTANFDLVLSLEERGEEIAASLNYATDLFDRTTVSRWMACLAVLLRGLSAGAAKCVDDLPILPEAELRQVVEFSNVAPQVETQDAALIDRLFERQAELTPRAVAVKLGQHSLTFEQLNERANQLARYLKSLGVGPDQLVGICIERSLDMVVGLLGILKAGGAYVPLDPLNPIERTIYMMEDAAPRVLLTHTNLQATLPSTGTVIVALDREWAAISKHAPGNLDARSDRHPDQLAYVIYTSGSTGMPKGVMVSHHNVTRLLSSTSKWFRFNQSDVWTLFHSFAFDFSVWEIWGALLHGGRLVVVPHLTTRAPERFYELLCEEGVTVLNQTPSAFAQLSDAQAHHQSTHSLRVVIFGGEALEFRSLRPWIQRNGAESPQLVNMYGITETTVHVTYRLLSGKDIESERGSVIGKPIPDLQTYLLNGRGHPVPIGVTGEIHVGGAGVSRGYLNRPQLTSDRFVRDPFSTDPRARLYKSGDLGRWRADGTLEYLGRNDHQVKIRGFRIELGEVEAQLVFHPDVKEAVVIAREDVPGEKQLVAYVIPVESGSEGPLVSTESLRTHLKNALPEHMVPSALVLLDRLPLTSNGKLDRKSLPAPDSDAHVRRAYEAPIGEMETSLAGIWESLLRVERVGRADHFFELGGHSLLIVRMLERLRRIGLSTQVHHVFERPTLADLAQTLSASTAVDLVESPMLSLVALEDQHIERIVHTVPGGASNVQDIYPLAPLQEGLLFHNLLSENRGDTYVVPTLLSVASRSQLNSLVAALQGVIDRHDILRTAVLWEQLPEPVQVVYRRAMLPVEEVVLEAGQDAWAQVKGWMRPEQQKMDLRKAPLMRMRVAQDPHGSQWYVLLQLHHIVGDNTSQEIILSEMAAYLRGQSEKLPEPIPYRIHVAQARNHAEISNSQAFFRQKLADVTEPTTPFGLIDVHSDGSETERAHETLEPSLGRKVRAWARRLGITPAAVFHAAWGLVIARTSGRDDVVFGSVLLGRMQNDAGGQRILGMFINTLPLRLKLRGVSAFELVENTQRELVELLGHEQASLAMAQRCSGISGSVPLFSALLNYRHSPTNADPVWNGVDGIKLLGGEERTNYPIVFSVDDTGEVFEISAQTNRRIDPIRMIEYLRTALRSLVDALENDFRGPVLSLAMLPEREWDRVVSVFNDTQTAFPHEKLIHELFEEHVERTPFEMALICRDRALSYSELNRRANQLARFLRRKAVEPGQLVALCVERGSQMIIGILGILKAGGAYVPLDPGSPPQRLGQILRDASPKLLLTENSLLGKFPDFAGELISVDGKSVDISAEHDENLDAGPSGLGPRGLAYVIYTSGSTGSPKGVMIEHRSVVNLWHGLERTVGGVGGCQRVALNASFNFDASVQQIVQILSGRTLFVIPQDVRLDAAALVRFVAENSIGAIDCTPSQLKTWITAGILAIPDNKLRLVLVGGEEIDPQLWQSLTQSSAITFVNVYGPTECAVDSTMTRLNGDTTAPHIGRPMENRRVYILTPHLQPIPIGVAGEIYIGGEGIARGYLNRPDLTAGRFIADPFSSDPQARLYLTGDLGRWRPDGNIEYLGRHDLQVKIRGYRIELGEIEAQIARHDGVAQAVVVVREDVPDEKRLVGYFVLDDGAKLTVENLRSHLESVLPGYMIPSALVEMSAFPLTPSGKLNRSALPEPESGSYARQSYEQPRGEVERILAEIWQEVLRVERIGRQDNFFELGGHSLHGVKLTVRIAQRLMVDLSMPSVFRYPTIKQMGEVVTSLRLTTASEPDRTIQKTVCRTRPSLMPLSFSQLSHWHSLNLGDRKSLRQIASVTSLQGRLDVAVLSRAVWAMQVRHEALSTRVVVNDGTPFQEVLEPRDIEMNLVDLTQIPRDCLDFEIQRIVAEVILEPVDTTVDPLWAVRLLRVSEDENVLVLAMDHLISDAYSMSILLRDLLLEYGSASGAHADPLPEIPIQFADYAARQHDSLGPWKAAHGGYWESKLEGSRRVRFDGRERLDTDSHGWESVPVKIGSSQKAQFEGWCRRMHTTLAMGVFTAYVGLMLRWGNAAESVFQYQIDGRANADLFNTIGYFASALYLRIEIREEDSFADLINRVTREYWEAYEHADFSYFDAQIPRPDFARNSAFNWIPQGPRVNSLQRSESLGGITTRSIPFENPVVSRLGIDNEPSIMLFEGEDKIDGGMYFPAGRFAREDIERFVRNLINFIDVLLQDPRKRVTDIPLQ